MNYHSRMRNHGAMVLVYAHLHNWGDFVRVNVGVHIPAPWFRILGLSLKLKVIQNLPCYELLDFIYEKKFHRAMTLLRGGPLVLDRRILWRTT